MGALTLQEGRFVVAGIVTDGNAHAAHPAIGELDAVTQVRKSCWRRPPLGHLFRSSYHQYSDCNVIQVTMHRFVQLPQRQKGEAMEFAEAYPRSASKCPDGHDIINS